MKHRSPKEIEMPQPTLADVVDAAKREKKVILDTMTSVKGPLNYVAWGSTSPHYKFSILGPGASPPSDAVAIAGPEEVDFAAMDDVLEQAIFFAVEIDRSFVVWLTPTMKCTYERVIGRAFRVSISKCKDRERPQESIVKKVPYSVGGARDVLKATRKLIERVDVSDA